MSQTSFLHRRIINLCLSVILIFFFSDSVAAGTPVKKYLTLHFINTGGGESSLVILPSGETVLIDTGSPKGGIEVARYLRSRKINDIDHLILTHPHYDHIGGVFSILSAFRIRHIYDNGISNPGDDLYREYIQILQQYSASYRKLRSGDSILLDDARIDILNPRFPLINNINEDSIAMRITYKDISLLFTGDMGKAGERRLISTEERITGRILKVGHHGEDDATSGAFLEAVRPEAAVISVNSENRYGRPKKEVLKRLANHGIKVYRTDIHGSIILQTDGEQYQIRSEKYPEEVKNER